MIANYDFYNMLFRMVEKSLYYSKKSKKITITHKKNHNIKKILNK